MIQLLWRNDRTFNQAVHMETSFYISTPIPYVNDRMSNGELEMCAYVRVEAHDIDILNSLILPCLIVETQDLGSTSVQSITCPQRTLMYYGMREQFGPPCIVKLTFQLEFYQVARSRYLLQARHCPLKRFG